MNQAPQIAVHVEVTDELSTTNTGKQQQVVFVHLGDRYPVRDTIWVEGQPKPAGLYVANRLYKSGYNFVLDLKRLAPKPAQAKSA